MRETSDEGNAARRDSLFLAASRESMDGRLAPLRADVDLLLLPFGGGDGVSLWVAIVRIQARRVSKLLWNEMDPPLGKLAVSASDEGEVTELPFSRDSRQVDDNVGGKPGIE